MKNFLLAFTAVLFASCSSSIKITGTWSNPKKPAKQYETILATALSNETVSKALLESDIATELEKTGIKVFKSIDEFPPSFLKDTLERNLLIQAVKEKNIDAILTVTMIKKESDSRYIPGQCVYSPLVHTHYHRFWGYYTYWQPCVYSPGYYLKEEIYYFETNLYDSRTEELIWSAQSQTYYFTTLKTASKDFAKAITAKLQRDGIILTSTAK